jgi:hypothetical protein
MPERFGLSEILNALFKEAPGVFGESPAVLRTKSRAIRNHPADKCQNRVSGAGSIDAIQRSFQ